MLIWQSGKPYDPSDRAFVLLDEWLTTGQRPLAAKDACWTDQGEPIAEGDNVWNGAWRGDSDTGACLSHYPAYRSPRNAAGSPLTGDLFKCARVPVADAIAQGFYAPRDVAPYGAMLEVVFPDGVCDYRRGDVARPPEAELGVL
ncbi:DUF6351 family protein [Oceanisphaera psychrotolerans]|uniref:DUF6351 family protein n=1 Tax=Oceanisphaera psychrotolerans TaxID=1414654 RepID=UPI000B1F989B|nr:DUF6351 family protein [Oceanisphaera psychrotolerans]